MWTINAEANLSSMQTAGHWWHFLYHRLSSLLDSQWLLLGVCEILPFSAPWEFSWRSQSSGTQRRQLSVMFSPCWCGLWDWNCKRERQKVICHINSCRLELHLVIFLPLVYSVWFSPSDYIQCSGSTTLTYLTVWMSIVERTVLEKREEELDSPLWLSETMNTSG